MRCIIHGDVQDIQVLAAAPPGLEKMVVPLTFFSCAKVLLSGINIMFHACTLSCYDSKQLIMTVSDVSCHASELQMMFMMLNFNQMAYKLGPQKYNKKFSKKTECIIQVVSCGSR